MLTLAQIVALVASLVHVAEMTMEALPPADRARVGEKVLARLDWIDGVTAKLHVDLGAVVAQAKSAVTGAAA